MVAYFEAFILYIILFLSGLSGLTGGSSVIPTEIIRIFLYFIPSLALIWYLLYRSNKIDLKIVKPGKKDLLSGLIAFPCLIAIGSVFSIISSLTGNDPGQLVTSVSSVSSWIIICIFCLLSAYLEESFFRYYLFIKKDKLGLSTPLVIVLSVFLFSIGHIYDGFWGVLNSAVAGFILFLIFLKFKSIHGIAIAHCFYNIIAIILSVGNNP